MIGPVRRGPFDARTPIEVSQVSLACARLPEAFDGFRVALVADLHFGRWVRDGFVRRVFRLVRSQQPDLLLLGGDAVNRAKPFAARYSASVTASLGSLRAESSAIAVKICWWSRR